MEPASTTPRNRLADETSPYLLQHAGNPVAWHPWGPEALALARDADRPILLSIGYSACHWCHVMAHESFEHAPTAALMNELFINVKVDREERPDLDRIYQIAQQLLTRHGGGWPLTMFLTPAEQLPFFGGTYFPREPRHGMPAFPDVLKRVAGYYHEQRQAIAAQGEQLREVFASLVPPPGAAGLALSARPLERAREQLEEAFDARHGGFSTAPKFPHAGFVERLLHQWAASNAAGAPDVQALHMATLTLMRMADGGIYDHVGGGFARYAVDAEWMIPHFEKMLYDNGTLLALYSEASLATGEAGFAAAARGTAAWVLREMQAPTGGYYSSLDADSESVEGRYYVWDRAEVEALLPPPEFAALAARFGLDRAPNFEHAHWHLHAFSALEEVARVSGVGVAEIQRRIERGLERLRVARERRVRPGRDDKLLTAWNALMIRGLAFAARALGESAYAASASRAVDFIRAELWRDGRLYATHKDGRSRIPAFLDDYAFLAEALLALLEARWRTSDLEFAVALAEALLTHFEDRQAGGFWFTAADAEPLIHRSKSFGDEALPSGNGVAARVLGRLGVLLGESRYLAAAERTLRAAWTAIDAHPAAHATLLEALDELLSPIETVVLRGPEEQLERWRIELGRLYAPHRLLLAIPADTEHLPAALDSKTAGSSVNAYVCVGSRCEAPLGTLEALLRRLRDGAQRAQA